MESDAGIGRVAALSGYASRSYFTRQFELHFGRRDAGWLTAG